MVTARACFPIEAGDGDNLCNQPTAAPSAKLLLTLKPLPPSLLIFMQTNHFVVMGMFGFKSCVHLLRMAVKAAETQVHFVFF